MGARSIATVSLVLGLFNVRVKLYKSADSEQISFNMINAKTGNRVRQKLVDAVTGEEVQRSETLKGHEISKDTYVTFTDEEIDNMALEKRDSVDLQKLYPVDEIDPLHIEKTYYTAPDKGNDRHYVMLYNILKDKNKCAFGTWVSRGKENLVIVRAYKHGLIIQQLFYDKEVRTFEDSCSKYELTPTELAMGNILSDMMTAKEPFDKSHKEDTFFRRVEEAVKIKLTGGTITAAAAPAMLPTNMEDVLRKSLLSMGADPSKIEAMIKGQTAAPKVPETKKKPAKRSKKVV